MGIADWFSFETAKQKKKKMEMKTKKSLRIVHMKRD